MIIAALVALATACVALAGGLTVLVIRYASLAGRAMDASDARGRADVAHAGIAADLRTAHAELEAARRDLGKQKEITRAIQALAAPRTSAVDAPGADPVDVLLALAGAESTDPAGSDRAVRASDAASAGGGADRLPGGGRPAPVSDELAVSAALSR